MGKLICHLRPHTPIPVLASFFLCFHRWKRSSPSVRPSKKILDGLPIHSFLSLHQHHLLRCLFFKLLTHLILTGRTAQRAQPSPSSSHIHRAQVAVMLFLSPDGIASAVGGSGYPISRLLLWFPSPAPTARRHCGMCLPPPSVGQRFKGVLGHRVGLHQPHVHG